MERAFRVGGEGISGSQLLLDDIFAVSAATGGQMGPAIASLVQSPFAFPFSAANPQYALQQQAAFPQAGFSFSSFSHPKLHLPTIY